jgi:invasion protein IalB
MGLTDSFGIRMMWPSLCAALICVGASAISAQDKPIGSTPSAVTKPAPAAAQPVAVPPDKAAAWSVDCANPGTGLVCKAVQTMIVAKTHQLLLAVSVSKNPADAAPAMLLHLPLGLFNPAGVSVAIDGAKPEKLEIQTCDVRGCYTGMAMTSERIAAMSGGTRLNIVFQNLKKQNITVPLPLAGFAAAFKKAVTP